MDPHLIAGALARRGRILTTPAYDGLVFLCGQLDHQPAYMVPEKAYFLATVEHETAARFEPIEEYGSAAYFNTRYGPQTAVGKVLGNTQPGDGALYPGRGYVQVTGRANVVKANRMVHDAGMLPSSSLVENPALLMQPAVAFLVGWDGMVTGMFTGKKFVDYFKLGAPDFLNARRIINGVDRAQVIADYAATYLGCMQ